MNSIKVVYPSSLPYIKVVYDETPVYIKSTIDATYIKVEYGNVVGGGSGSAFWGGITGTLSNQTDLQTALDGKFDDPTGTTSQYIRGDGSLATFPTATTADKLITEVYNKTGATLTKGTVVYINGTQGNLPAVTKAIANSDATSAQTFGIVQSDILNMSNGYVVVAGKIYDLDTSAYADGTQLYLSGTTAGTYTSTKQYAPIHLVYVGVVVRSHPTQGIIEVKIQNGYEADEIHDFAVHNPINNDGIFYNSSNQLWEKKNISVLQNTDYDVDITGLRNSSNKLFTLSANFVANTTKVYVNGLRYTKGSGYDYVETGNNQITFSIAPDLGDLIVVDYIKL